MKFLIAGRWDEQYKPPYDGVVWGTYTTIESSRLRKGQPPKTWHQKGYNHRVEGSLAFRDVDDEGWMVKFSKFDELAGFIEAYNNGYTTIDAWGLAPGFMRLNLNHECD